MLTVFSLETGSEEAVSRFVTTASRLEGLNSRNLESRSCQASDVRRLPRPLPKRVCHAPAPRPLCCVERLDWDGVEADETVVLEIRFSLAYARTATDRAGG